MARALIGNVYVHDPVTGESAFYAAGAEVAKEHVALIGDHLWDGPAEQEKATAPAQSAPKSEWVAYAESLGLDGEGTKAEIQDAVAKAESDQAAESQGSGDGDSPDA
jgi:3-deoxy-D-manno-octulosonate 8-phosphate phosphatase KdsC-like HAD superfamily phosphatase